MRRSVALALLISPAMALSAAAQTVGFHGLPMTSISPVRGVPSGETRWFEPRAASIDPDPSE